MFRHTHIENGSRTLRSTSSPSCTCSSPEQHTDKEKPWTTPPPPPPRTRYTGDGSSALAAHTHNYIPVSPNAAPALSYEPYVYCVLLCTFGFMHSVVTTMHEARFLTPRPLASAEAARL